MPSQKERLQLALNKVSSAVRGISRSHHSDDLNPALPATPQIYKKLPTETCIRLLKISNPPYRGLLKSAESEIAITLAIADLENSPKFRALSYTWGNPYRNPFEEDIESAPILSCRIVCNNISVAVTQNLFDALHTFRKAKVKGYLWVDALCINQEDLDERSSQVSLMSKIYPSASEVLVWLGRPAEGLDEFIWATTEFLDSVQDPSTEDAKDIFSPGNMGDEAFWHGLGLEEPSEKLIKVAMFYKSCRWFSRGWVIQEIALSYSTNRLRMFCGEHEFSFKKVFQVANIILVLGWHDEISNIICFRNSRTSPFDWLRELFFLSFIMDITAADFKEVEKNWKPESGRLWFLCQLLWLFRFTSCMDPRDMIYSLLGIASFRFSQTSPDEWVRANYTITMESLCTQVTSLILNNSLYLDYITDPRRRSQAERDGLLPSWAVDYSSPRAAPLLNSADPDPIFDAALCATSKYPTFKVTGDRISCYGARFDVIQEAQEHDLATCLLGSVSALREYYKFYLSLPSLMSGRRRFEVLWRTLVTNRDGILVGTPPPSSFEEQVILWEMDQLGGLSLNASTETEKQEVDQIMADLTSTGSSVERFLMERLTQRLETIKAGGDLGQRELEMARDDRRSCTAYARLISSNIVERKLFKTDRGLLGLGLTSLEKNDQVWLLTDAHVPIVLRPSDNPLVFTVVGGCYILDFMIGEMLEDQYGFKANIGPISII